MKVAVVGAGISGLVSAYELAKSGVKIVIYEKENYIGGHAKTVTVNGVDLDLGFMVFNRVTYPNMMEFFESLGVDMEISDMSFSVSLDKGHGCEWGSRNGISGLFAQKKNVLNPYFWQMIREIIRFKQDVISYLEELDNNPDIDRNETLGHFIQSRGYSELFQKAYLVPICASIWSCPSDGVMSFSAYSILSFCRNHHLLQLFGRPQWLTVRWRSQTYVNKVKEELEKRGCQIRIGCEVNSVYTNEEGCTVACTDGSKDVYDGCIMAAHAPDTLRMLGKEATYDETRILGAFQYVYSDIFLHCDKTLLPRNPAAWSSWNFLGTMNGRVCVTYWLNILQNLGETERPYCVTLNPPHTPDHTLLKWTTGHPVPSVAASKASSELYQIQGKRGIWFCGAYQGHGFHEDGLKAGAIAAQGLLKRNFSVLKNPKHMVPTWTETGARLLVTRFLKSFIATGCIILLEEGGTMFTFEGTEKKCSLKVSLRVHSPQFYWKVATQGDLGLADAFIHGDFSFVDKNDGLLNLFMIFVNNRDLKASVTRSSKKRGWWTPLLFTAAVSSAKYFIRHVSNQNTLTQARRNISRHYDLSNELFSLFLDETMTYSCAIFKSEEEDLKVAQERKISLLIEKAKVKKEHHILEIGCGWGSLAVEVVKRTGCKYTGITLSEQQLKYAQLRVQKAGLQDHITFLLCDYRQLPNTSRYDRIISCEMLEAVGHEFMEEFFTCCESALAEDGLLVLQFISIPDERYDEYRQSSDFIKEYIFPGGCLPALSRVTSAMATASRLCVEHLEDIGIHYYQTLRCWRKNFLEKQSQIHALGFDDKFIRTWEYYFDYCAAGFKTCTLGDYQIVFSRPGNVAAFGDPYNGVPSENPNQAIPDNPKHMVSTWPETGARLLVTRFFRSFIQTGSIILLEEGGTIFTFQGTDRKCSLKVSLRVHSTQFYWKIATQADIGLADAFIHGDFSFVDKNEGLLNLIVILIANTDLKESDRTSSKKSGWWTPVLFTAALSSAKYFIRHVSNRNTLTQARRNISRHYDLSNELFSLFLDETMTYSCAIFKSENEDLKDAQLRKINVLIRKAKISKEHHILEIGFGWGSFAVEVVKQTGCKYTGITLSEQQLDYAQLRVEQAGLQDQITFILCDYRQIPNKDKYDRIISIGMIEHVGHDYIEEFFACCESALTEDGVLVLQFVSIPDEMYDNHRHSTGFIREYIFPGGCLLALSRITSGMAAASRLCVVHLEEIGIHYDQTLRCWRNNFLKNKSQIRALGFDDMFIRTWEYYFDYCAAGFKTRTIGDYQIVFSRPGNVAVFDDPYHGVPAAF